MDNAIQWHLELKVSNSTSQEQGLEFMHPSEIMGRSNIPSWLKQLDPKKLSDSRVFLGWTSKAQVLLGTADNFASIVDVSGAFDSELTRCVKTFGGSAGIGMQGFASLSATISGTRSVVASGISGIESKEDDAVILFLANGIKNHVIIYNDDEETGWLIPQTTTFLFLVQIYLPRQPRGLEDLPSELLSLPAHDGGQAAFETLSRIKDSKTNLNGIDLWPLIKETCHHLFHVSHELHQIYTDARNAFEVAPDFIFGVELVDVALKEASMPVKKAKVSSPWAHLAEH
jgi:hypothetical protein